MTAFRVIGAGHPRTGTLSLRTALTTLGFGPCYHMDEVFRHPEHHQPWRRVAAGHADFEFLDGYCSIVDAPGCYFFRELLAHSPDAKVILGVRPAAEWYASVHSTIYQAMTNPVALQNAFPQTRQALALGRELVLERFHAGRFEDEADACARFEAHNDAVRREVPADRLLVYQITDGWQPLCEFLGAEVPDTPFPRTNDRDRFRARLGLEPAPR